MFGKKTDVIDSDRFDDFFNWLLRQVWRYPL